MALAVLSSAARAGASGSPCAAPAVVGGAPTAVVVVIDGVTSKEPVSGSAYPIPVAHPAAGIPQVDSYCPVGAAGHETQWPNGINGGLHVWSQDPDNPDGLPGTTACVAGAGLRTGRCLVGELADTGAILLPYSYRGATVQATGHGPVFRFTAYQSKDTEQPLATSVAQLDDMVRSIVSAWPKAAVYVVGHSLGGLIAEAWWQGVRQAHERPAQVKRVFSLDSPINGIANCLPGVIVLGLSLSGDMCSRWNGRDALDQQILALDRDGSYVAFGANGDPAYAPLISGGGDLRPQLIYKCPDGGESSVSPCIATPPSYVSPCNPAAPHIEGDGHHLVVACPAVISRIVSAPANRPLRLEFSERCSAHGTMHLALEGDLWAVRRVRYTRAGGHGHRRRVTARIALTRHRTKRIWRYRPACA